MKFFISSRRLMQVTVVLVLLYAVLCAAATFIENEWGTASAWRLVYEARYFQVLAIGLAAALVLDLLLFRVWRRSNWPVGLFHLAFLLILIGYGLTQSIGIEGTMALREGETSNKFVSNRPVFWWQVAKGDFVRQNQMKKLFSSVGINHLSDEIEVDNEKISIKLTSYRSHVRQTIVPDSSGVPFVFLTVAAGHNRFPLILKCGQTQQVGGVHVGFENTDARPDIQISMSSEGLTFVSQYPGVSISMKTRIRQQIEAGDSSILEEAVLYQMGGIQLALNRLLKKGRLDFVPVHSGDPSSQSVLDFDVNNGQETYEVVVPASIDQIGDPVKITLGDVELQLYYGLMETRLPFTMTLKSFDVGWYGGSNRPSSFTSQGVAKDQNGNQQPFTIAMNQVFEFGGYRFFQSSYDEDEQGSILSVQKDPGTRITYAGYLVSIIAMLFQLLRPNSRFRKLGSKIKQAALLVFVVSLLSPKLLDAALNPQSKPVPASLAKTFGHLLVQDVHGRIKPMNTLSNEIILKISHDKERYGQNPDQLTLGIFSNPRSWRHVPLVHVPSSVSQQYDDLVENSSFASLNGFFDPHSGRYRLQDDVHVASSKKASERTAFDKDLLKVDERVHVLYMLINHRFLKIIPSQKADGQWLTFAEAMPDTLQKERHRLAMKLNRFLSGVDEGTVQSESTLQSNLAEIISDQRALAVSVPSPKHIQAELLFNQLQIFERMMPVLMAFGCCYLLLALGGLFSTRKWIRSLLSIFPIFVIGLLMVQAWGLGLRWYVSGHAPWSNGYESMIYTGWAVLLAGLVFARRWPLAIAASVLFSGFIFLVAHLSWMDPQITPLVPVLKSYWLTIHVSIMMLSYGCFGLVAVLALVSLIFMAIVQEKSRQQLERQIHILTLINERTLLLGLVLLYIGTVFGSVWANESWGRYWGWDAKETWTLIALCVYTLVTHLHLLVRYHFAFWLNTGALLAFSTILMTYFGVNYYLSGLHSYAQGNPAPLHWGWLVIFAGILTIIATAFLRIKKD